MHERLRGVFASLPEMRFEVGGRTVEVNYSIERMREDFVREGSMRGLDERSLKELAEAFTFEEDQSSGNHTHIMKANTVMKAPLETSRFQIEYSYGNIQRHLKFIGRDIKSNKDRTRFFVNKNSPQADKQISNDVIVQNTDERLNEWWRHEREHLLQEFTLSPDKDDEIHDEKRKLSRKNEIKAAIVSGICSLGYPFVRYGLTGDITSFELFAILPTGFTLQGGLALYLNRTNHLHDKFEKQAYTEEIDGCNLPNIFGVRIVEDRRNLPNYQSLIDVT